MPGEQLEMLPPWEEGNHAPAFVPEDAVRVKVKWATNALDFIPFTNLPAKYHGKTVALVIVPDVPQHEPTALLPPDGDSFGETAKDWEPW